MNHDAMKTVKDAPTFALHPFVSASNPPKKDVLLLMLLIALDAILQCGRKRLLLAQRQPPHLPHCLHVSFAGGLYAADFFPYLEYILFLDIVYYSIKRNMQL